MKYKDHNGHVIKNKDTVYFHLLKCSCLITEDTQGYMMIQTPVYRLRMTRERAFEMTILAGDGE